MLIAKLIGVMMGYFRDTRLIEHAVKAYSYAYGIGGEEGYSEADMFILSAAAVLHDIGIPQAVKLHGSAKGEFQEREGAALAPEMLGKAGIDGADIVKRVAWLVGHHHNEALAGDDALLQALMEADYLVNLAEGNHPMEKASEIKDSFFKTKTGKRYITSLFNLT